MSETKSEIRNPTGASEQLIVTPLCVDLDGTLIKSDLLWESFLTLILTRPLYAIRLPLWLIHGKAYLKSRIAELIDLDVSTIPINEEVVAFIRQQKSTGRQIVLATASHESLATKLAASLDCFDNVIGTSTSENIAGIAKRDRLIREFGEYRFDYIGNSRADLPVWKAAKTAIVANASIAVAGLVKRALPTAYVLSTRRRDLRNILQSLRPHQWVKNFLVFVPLFVSHNVSDPLSIRLSIFAFCAFTLCSSSVYLINDLVDIQSDRRHRTKRNRPIASGLVSIRLAAVLVFPLLLGAITIAVLMSQLFTIVLISYFTLTLLYSLILKQKLLLDVVLLASLYTMRIIAGAFAISVPLSFWLLAFSIFLFLSLALVKRYSEIGGNERDAQPTVDGRGYTIEDLQMLGRLGTASGYISVLVLALYINSDAVALLYRQPEYLWLVCPPMLYWISLIWVLAGRGDMNEDPVVFAITDVRSYIVAISIAILVFLGT